MNTYKRVFIQFQSERQIDLLGNARAAVARIALFHFDDGVDDFLGRSLWPWFSASARRIQQTIPSFLQGVVELEQGGWLDDHRRSDQTPRIKEER